MFSFAHVYVLDFNNIMLAKIIDFVKRYFSDIILFIIIVLLMMLSFATGYITAKNIQKTPITIEQKQ
ncbi:MAG: hypothetical protein A2599_02830 [Candidatus Staskawiczbacteria bacterium RIFOXYD1_FULL_39_28]|uniref:Uncharacterized protein n=1 Tax=Candidatus Staskawiczbacteria bacterium RIFOXYC1_FULL_38_18 TaxID=1802229 RepID=A0A1G2JC92_9BACT|nr:MAG: hypothetical protein A2401_01330 [Candidatus Staskawiczbacteria bacterium RIFOXYC1_FULL_38_18]OGZ91045.1 MAG: hypothetical protein A2599_02830 [Candidatus Staskawiczbacteria bacterium RIFOXYD1_FULL_39_28]